MSQAEVGAGISVKQMGERVPLGRVGIAAGIAAALTLVVLVLVVAASTSAWSLLAAGRNLIPEAYYPASGFLLVLATTVGQLVGWAGASALCLHVLTLLRIPATWTSVRLAMSVIYLGLTVLPLLAYEVIFGQPLLGLPRTGLEEWLAATHPDAHWLLFRAHPVVDYSLLPLAAVFLGVLWGAGERVVRQSLLVQTILALALFLTSLSVALSLGIHSTLVHIRMG
ncbi:MAG: hypothetical protein ACE147_02695 [Candidatus Methylomirabilales bacterium]